MIDRLAIAGYRSLRDVTLGLERLTIVTGANGSGKSSLYRALRLLTEVAQGRIIQSLAGEGGLQSTLWAGPEKFSRRMIDGDEPVRGTTRSSPVSLRLGFSGDDYGYAIDLGLPIPSSARFDNDPDIKVETAWVGPLPTRSGIFAERRGPGLRIRDSVGVYQSSAQLLAPYESMMMAGAGPGDGLDLLIVRERMRSWRFHDHLRTDADAPARRPQIGTYTPVLAGDGADLAAAIATIDWNGDRDGLRDAVADAFPGCRIDVDFGASGTVELTMQQPGLLRALRAAELSEGTLRYLLLLATLLSPRPPELMVLNEPESSLHPDLIAPLARLIAAAARQTQIVLISHSEALVGELRGDTDCRHYRLEKRLGETLLDDDPPEWTWPKR